MADFQDEILSTYKGETEPVFELVPVDTNEYKLTLKNTISQAGTPFAKSNIALKSEVNDATIEEKIVTPKALSGFGSIVTSGEALSAGDALYIDKSTGKAKAIEYDRQIADLITLQGGTQGGFSVSIHDTSDDNIKVAIYYTTTTTLKARCIDLTDIDSPLLKTEYTITSTASTLLKSVTLSDDVIIVSNKDSGANHLDMFHLAVNTTTFVITSTTNADVKTDMTDSSHALIKIDSTHLAVVYTRSTDVGITYVTVTGTSISGATTVQFYTSSTGVALGELLNTNVIVAGLQVSNYYRCAYWTGATWTLGTVKGNSIATWTNRNMHVIADNTFVEISHDTSTEDEAAFKLSIFVADGSYDLTQKYYESYGLTNLSQNFNTGSSYFDSNTNLLYITTEYLGYNNYMTIFKIYEDMRPKLITQFPLTTSLYDSASTDIYYTQYSRSFYSSAGVNMLYNKNSGNLLFALYSTNASNYGCFIRVIPSLDKFYDLIGWATEGVATDTELSIKKSGTIKNLTGLTAGNLYYVQEDGSYGTTITQQKIGTAISTTEIALSPEFIHTV